MKLYRLTLVKKENMRICVNIQELIRGIKTTACTFDPYSFTFVLPNIVILAKVFNLKKGSETWVSCGVYLK